MWGVKRVEAHSTYSTEMANVVKKLEAELETVNKELTSVRSEKELSEQKFERLKAVLDKERQA